jgi:N-acyl-D-aspartate/D-glutamate deacylase
MIDLLIRGGTVIDGTGAAPIRADVGVDDGRIVFVGDSTAPDKQARRIVDAEGLVVAPGFVDIHTHYDAQLFWDPACTPSSLHGVTTVFCGNCGFSIAPLGDDPAYMVRMLSKVEGIPLESLEAGVPWSWKTFDEYLSRLQERGAATNVGVSVGHSALRRCVMGERSHSDPSPGDLDAMKALLSTGLSSGAAGFTSSWGDNHLDGEGDPVPSRLAGGDELVALSVVLRSFPGSQLEFIPTNGSFEDAHLDVMTRMAVSAGAPLNWNVLVTRNHEWVRNRMRATSHARAQGATVLGLSYPDVMPVRFSFMAVGFHATGGFDEIPEWGPVLSLGVADRLAALKDPACRAALRRGAETPIGRARHLEDLSVAETSSPDNELVRGIPVGELAARSGRDPVDVLLDIVIADDLRTLLRRKPIADDDPAWEARVASWQDPDVIIGASDGGAHVDVLATFDYPVRFLARQRELGALSLPETIRKLSDVPARLYGLAGRGRLASGYWADIVILDEGSVGPGPLEWKEDLPAGAGRLYSEPEGISRVMVRGVEIVSEGRVTGATPGRILRRSNGQCS